MTKDELKKQLHSYRDREKERQQIAQELERLTAYKSPRLDGMPRGSGTGDPTGNIATQRAALLERYEIQLERLAAAQLKVEEMIEGLDPMARQIMRHRYIEGLAWEAVCVAIGYSWRQTHNIHAGALDTLMEKYG